MDITKLSRLQQFAYQHPWSQDTPGSPPMMIVSQPSGIMEAVGLSLNK